MAEYIYSSDWIKKLESLDHWKLYWSQQKLMEGYLKPNSKLVEVGVGSGFCSNYLRSKGHTVHTIDIDKDKNPDYVTNVVDWTPKERYDALLAFEIFEHVPFEEFQRIIGRLKEIQIPILVISIPFNTLSKKALFRLGIRFPYSQEKWFEFLIPPFVKIKTNIPAHHWEIGDKNVSNEDYHEVYNLNGFELISEFKMMRRLFSVFQMES